MQNLKSINCARNKIKRKFTENLFFVLGRICAERQLFKMRRNTFIFIGICFITAFYGKKEVKKSLR